MKIDAARIVFGDDDRAEILRRVDASLRTGALTLGPNTLELEAGFATRHDSPFAVATSSGTSALEIIFRALGVEGKEVVVPANTFFATAAAVVHAGGRVRLADVDPETLALDPASLEAALTPETVGVVHVHIGGLVSPAVPAIAELCRARGVWLVEDAAHAHGSSFEGRPAGTFGVAGAFSLYPTKVITSGEGGVIVTADERLRDEAVVHRDQGKAGFLGGDHVRMGAAWRMSEPNAAIGVVHLGRLDGFIARRSAIAARYRCGLEPVGGIRALPLPPGCVSNFYKFVALLDPGADRDRFKQALRDRGVNASGEVYAKPLHAQPIFADLPHGPLPHCDDVCARHVCLPVHSDMTDEEAAYVVSSVQEVLADHG
ncbi:MAG: DegT/DnrJ/EryC1/StrS aminotransferase [Actinomycetia bacterium]|nr:DegT/DnrJ/EryC1/StrS aminotransferase [Actinomycetes bacterium]